MDSNLAAWTQPFANAVDWVINIGGAKSGSRVAVIGPGYHGVAAVAAATAVGAEEIVVLGRNSAPAGPPGDCRGHGRLHPHQRQRRDNFAALGSHGKGNGFDVIVDTVGLGGPALGTTEHLRKLGRLVLAGSEILRRRSEPENPRTGASGVVGVRGRSPEAVTRSIELLAAGNTGLEHVPASTSVWTASTTCSAPCWTGQASSPHVVIRPAL
ncbi:hypothetical protein [Arthrobacter crystallopoietes]|uniref:hypothetical protein n=1 Tax=Crystallibacter crystallopoietes TaxID=37928 RepID=UPI0011138EB9|nr:hypothetical protein [Arthrobacter crystallopoietes]